MQTLEAIAQRRSIRKFKDTPVTDEQIRSLLHAATLAPSGKNAQPWRFVVVRGEKRAEMAAVMRAGMENLKALGVNLGSSPWTVQIMERAPVTIFVFNDDMTLENGEKPLTAQDMVFNSVAVQSIGASIQNLLLAAHDMGLGTLWICDVFFAYPELCTWLGETHQMIAAVSVGYPDETPSARPRKSVDDVTRWI
ncbi:MAG TPA: nitroreductase [Anaerolineae bacterium]|nr:nitroreductase [Anaerolineae bacterium]HQI85996.1 nitroreductase [Anaerolineae bacterium]